MVASITQVDSEQRLALIAGTNFKDYIQPAVGDWVMLIWTSQNKAPLSRSPIVPTGWTTIHAYDTIGTGTASIGIYAKKYTDAADLLHWEIVNFSGASQINALALHGKGADVEHWQVGNFGYRELNATTTTAKAPTVSSYSSGMAFTIGAERTAAEETHAQVTVSGSTKQWVRNNTSTLLVGATKSIGFGATGEVVFTFPNSHATNGFALTIIIPDANPTGGPLKGYPIRMVTDTGTIHATFQVQTRVDNQLVLETPRSIRVVPPPSYSSVTDMLSKSFFKVAHRGGSADFPEMSMYAYGQSALWGYGALEISLGVTSDKVFFGLHDPTLLRTSGFDLDPQGMTWESVSLYPSLGGTPYMRLEELCNKYPNHIIFIDPKSIPGALYDQILDVMDTHGGPSRFVAKGYGGQSAWAARSRARGYKNWGVLYTVDQPNLTSLQSHWDLLGMDYTASQAIWTEARSFGKPVIGHVCPNAAAINTAISRGASGVMVSGVKAGIPF